MYLVKTYIDKSGIEGTGVFAGEDIPKGKAVWKLVRGFDQVFKPADILKLPEDAQEYIKKHGWLWRGSVYMSADNGLYTNHSDDPNTIESEDRETEFAARDIKKGEELTCNYREFSEEFMTTLLSMKRFSGPGAVRANRGDPCF